MNELKLHSAGFESHLEVLKDTYEKSIRSIKNDGNLPPEKQKKEILKIKEKFRLAKKDSRQKLF